jgi:hypothetical protein
MGGNPYWYFVPFEPDVASALRALRAREFKAGRYSPVLRHMNFSDPNLFSKGPGPQHDTIEAAVTDAGDAGTSSILDIDRVSSAPDYGAAAPLEAETLEELYGTTKPTHEMVETMEFLDDVERGQCAYIIVYGDGRPSETCFAGYSYD